MRLHVRQILEAEDNYLTLPLAETVDLGGEGEVLPPVAVKGQIHILISDKHLWVRGELSGQVTLECIRCLKAFPQTLRWEMEELCLLTDTLPPDALEEDRWTEAGEYQISPEGTLDVTEMVRQNLLLVWPTLPLCRSDCPGLAAVETEPAPEQPQVDPRLEKLQLWLERQENH